MIKRRYYIRNRIKIKRKQADFPTEFCACGNLLPYRTSPFMTTEKRVCPKCGKIHNVDYAPVDWAKACKLPAS